MNLRTVCSLVPLLMAASAFAAEPAAKGKPISVDKSASFLVDEATTEKLWADNLPAKVKKLYPASRWRFVSDVGGGFTESRTCVVTRSPRLQSLNSAVLAVAWLSSIPRMRPRKYFCGAKRIPTPAAYFI